MGKALMDVLPPEFIGSEYSESAAYKHRDQLVIASYGTIVKPDGTRNWKPWPGTHKNVQNWHVLANGRAVGWNEGPQGWTFAVIRYQEAA